MFAWLRETFDIYSANDLMRALADLTIVYLAIYQVLLLIQGTRAVQVLMGLVLVIIGYFLSREEFLGLTTLHWLLDKFIASFILLVVVLFQQDIRRGLANVGQNRLLSGESSREEAYLVEEVVRACFQLSRLSLGGLMAIEMRGDLERYAEDGFRLDAKVSRELLFAIFNPEHANPLHDGATVIRRDRVVAAGCFLPLSSDPRIPRALGTRHRAGIGLSEDTDAIVLIVSEETGRVSVALGGVLHLGLDQNALREFLQKQLGVRDAKRAAVAPTWWQRLVRKGGR